MAEIQVGAKGEVSVVVTQEVTAAQWGSGLAPTYSTPAMVGLMEGAASDSLQPFLEAGQTSVGIEICVRHLAATPVGMRVKAAARVAEVQGRRVRFEITAWDEQEKIGEGTHWRAVVDAARFRERFEQKAARAKKQGEEDGR